MKNKEKIYLLNNMIYDFNSHVFDNVQKIIDIHNKQEDIDSLVYYDIGFYYIKNCKNDCHKEIFISKMFISKNLDIRKKISNIIFDLDPNVVNNIIDHISGKSHKTKKGKVFEIRIGKNIPRILKSSVKKYIRRIENNNVLFDNFVEDYFHDIKSLYCRLRIKPGNEKVRHEIFCNKYKNKNHNIKNYFDFKKIEVNKSFTILGQ
jgi:hypothetical protein